MKTIESILAVIEANKNADKDDCFEGLNSSEIGQYSRYLMFGPNDEGFPSEAEWSGMVD